jgi:cytochrome c553
MTPATHGLTDAAFEALSKHYRSHRALFEAASKHTTPRRHGLAKLCAEHGIDPEM